MWIKIRNKLMEWFSWVCAVVFVILITALTLIVPITIILGCLKLIFMMFGV